LNQQELIFGRDKQKISGLSLRRNVTKEEYLSSVVEQVYPGDVL